MTAPQVFEADTPNRPELNAERFLEAKYMEEGVFTLAFHRKVYRAWDGMKWTTVDLATLKSRVYGIFKNAIYPNQDGEPSPWPCTTTNLNNVHNAIQNEVLVDQTVNFPAWIENREAITPNADPPLPANEMIACRNKLVHAPTRREFEHTPRFFNTTAMHYDYDAEAPTPVNWLAFLNELWPDDAESIDTLQEIFGYCMTTRTDLQKMFMLIGPPRSGKGTIVRVLEALVGAGSSESISLSDLNNTHGLESLESKQLGIMQDVRFRARTDAIAVERLLSITGEDKISINPKGEKIYSVKLPVRFLLVSNELPILKDASGALRTRMVLLKTRSSVHESRRDRHLADRLYVELPSILNWALDGLERLDRRGFFQQPKSAQDDVEFMAKLSSDMESFAEDCLVEGLDELVTHEDFYAAYKRWCDLHGIRVPKSQVVGRDLRAKITGVESKQRTIEGRKTWCYLGVNLNAETRAAVDGDAGLQGFLGSL